MDLQTPWQKDGLPWSTAQEANSLDAIIDALAWKGQEEPHKA